MSITFNVMVDTAEISAFFIVCVYIRLIISAVFFFS